MPDKIVHLDGLNGIRAIAALAVVVAHTTIALGEFGLDPYLFGRNPDGGPAGIMLAQYGVTMFFCLSGFLIGYLLLLEKDNQPVDIRNFYIRRVLRIWPLYYAYLAAAVIVTVAVGNHAGLDTLPYYLLLAANVPFILGTAIPLLAHYWSLAVEEQFYLFFPWVVGRIGRSLPAFLIGFAVLFLAAKALLRYVDLGQGPIPFMVLDLTRFQCMMIGAVGAWYYHAGDDLFLRATTNLPVQLLCWFVVVLLVLQRFHIASIIDHEIVAAVTPCIIVGQVTGRNRIVPLDLTVLDFLGKISYGLYVLHPLVIFLLGRSVRFEGENPLDYVLAYGLVLGTTIGLAYASYRYFERPFLRQKERFSAVLSSPAKTTRRRAVPEA